MWIQKWTMSWTLNSLVKWFSYAHYQMARHENTSYKQNTWKKPIRMKTYREILTERNGQRKRGSAIRNKLIKYTCVESSTNLGRKSSTVADFTKMEAFKWKWIRERDSKRKQKRKEKKTTTEDLSEWALVSAFETISIP